MRTQEQITKELVGEPYIKDGWGDDRMPSTYKNRENQVSRKDDTHQDYHVGIKDIDETIIYYFNNVILPNVTVNGQAFPVPIVYGDPEKWKAVQKDGSYRDKQGKRQVPVIVFKRDSLEKNRAITSKVDANNPHNLAIVSRVYTGRNQYTAKYIKGLDRIPQQAFAVTVVPDYVKLSYSCTIVTDLMSQMNPIVEAINFASDSYWGDVNRFKFQSIVDSFKTEIKADDSEDRTVVTSFGIKMNGYIIPSTFNAEKYTHLKRYSNTHIRTTISEGIYRPE